MAHLNISVLLLLTTCFLFIYGINVADITDNAYSNSLILSKLRAKRLPCEIRDPFTGGCAIPGPRNPFRRSVDELSNDVHHLKKRELCEIRDPFTGGCAIPGPRNPF